MRANRFISASRVSLILVVSMVSPPHTHPPHNQRTNPIQVPYATGRAERVVGEYDEFIRRMVDQIGRSKEQVRGWVGR